MWEVTTAALIAVVGFYFSALSVEMHRSLATSAYDFGLYDQGIWLLSRFHSPFVTLMGRNLFGDHTSFILLFLVPIYWVVGSTSLLFVVQALVIVAGAVPVFLFTRKRLDSEAMATVFVAVYLLHPATVWIALENFHPDAFLGVLIATALYAAFESKWRMYLIAVLLAMSVKEDVVLILFPLGIWVAWRRQNKFGLFTALISFWYSMVAIFGIQRGINGVPFRNGWRIPFGGLSGSIATLFTDPMALVRYLISDSRPFYVLQLVAPVALGFIVFPEIAAIAGLVIFTNIFSSFWYQYHIEYHYSFVVVPVLVIGTVFAIGRLRKKWRRILVSFCALSTLVCAYLWAPLPGARTRVAYSGSSNPAVIAARVALSKVPDDAVVSAYHPLTAHLARRTRIYAFPVPFKRALYGMDAFASGDILPFTNDIEFVILPASMDEGMQKTWREVSAQFAISYANEWWIVYQRKLPG
ncbi:hypothetical protein EMGBS4_15140 [Acidimicrobiaceae bacterium]|nr:hypothetical protein EMGBS4_15140 [Acidimicrobiaceae bacterium]